MKAKIVSSLSGIAAEGDHFEPHGTLQHVAHIPRPGVICQLKLGANGLQYCRGGVTTHVIPRAELIALFEKLEPKFGEAPNGITRPREVDELGAPIQSPVEAIENSPGLKPGGKNPKTSSPPLAAVPAAARSANLNSGPSGPSALSGKTEI